jgi:DNA polymerase I
MAIFSLDLETTSTDFNRGSIIMASWCGTDLVPHAELWSNLLRNKIARWLYDPKNTVITQNGVFDYSWLLKKGIIVRAKQHDTMIASHVIESNAPADLGSLVNRYLTQELFDNAGIEIQIDETWKKDGPKLWLKENSKWIRREKGRKPHFGDVPTSLLLSYAKKDALHTLLVWFTLKGFLKGKNKWSYDLDMAMLPIILGMKLRGIPLDVSLCRRRKLELEKEQQAFLDYFNIDKVGPKAIIEKIFPVLGIKPRYKTEKGNWRLNERAIRQYQVLFPEHAEILERLIQYRKAKQSSGTYYSGWLKCLHRGKINPTFNLTNAKTGRFSSSGPNFQNVKKRGGERAAFLVRPGYINLHWDYDQIELRILAHYSREPHLVDIFQKGIDPHTRTVELMGITEENAKSFLSGKYREQDPRFIGKQVNYSYWYGMGPLALSLDLGIPLKKAKELFQRYRMAYPKAETWSRNTINEAKRIGYVEDIFGRRYYPDDKWSYYKLINYLIQGTAAQVIKLGMLRAQYFLCKDPRFLTIIRDIPLHTMHGIELLTIHDEIGIEVEDKQKKVEYVIPGITEALTIKDIFIIPLTVGLKWTRTNWAELKEIEKEPITWGTIKDEKRHKMHSSRHKRKKTLGIQSAKKGYSKIW